MVPNIDHVIDIIRRVAAAEVMPRFGNLAPGDVVEKGPGNYATTADTEAERLLTEALMELVPGSAVVGEEETEADPARFAALAGVGPVWLIDPVDGTQNFVEGRPAFAVIVAFCQGGRTLAGWIHDPVSDVTLWAADGEGAWRGGQRLRAAAAAPLTEMTGFLTSRVRRRLQARQEAGLSRGPRITARHKCTGREYMDLGQGTVHFAQYRRLKPWDHAAGILIHREAGGFSGLRESRRPYAPHAGILDETILLAPDEATWTALAEALGD